MVKTLLQIANFTLGPDATLNTEIHKKIGSHKNSSLSQYIKVKKKKKKKKKKNQINHYSKQRRVLMANFTVCQSK